MTKMLQRIIFVVIGLVVVALVWWAVTSLDKSEAKNNFSSEIEGELLQTPNTIDGRLTQPRVELSNPLVQAENEVKFFDLLSEEELPFIQMELEADGLYVEFTNQDSVLASDLKDQLKGKLESAIWKYRVPWTYEPNRDFEISYLRAPLQPDGRVLLPYHSGIRGKILEAHTWLPSFSPQASAWSSNAGEEQDMMLKISELGGIPSHAFNDLTLFQTLREHTGGLSTKKFTAKIEDDGRYFILVLGEGKVFVEAKGQDHERKNELVYVEPGSWIELDFLLRIRPTLTGTISDPSGRPLSGFTARVGVHFDTTASIDFSTSDGMGHTATWNDSEIIFTTSPSVMTDRNGRYRLNVPIAREYSILASTKDAFGFAVLNNPNPDPQGVIHLELQLEDFSDNDRVQITLLWENGQPIEGVELGTGILDDPYHRQFPTLKSNDKGVVSILWRRPGIRYGYYLREGLLRKTYSGHLEPGQFEIVIPNHYRKEGQE